MKKHTRYFTFIFSIIFIILTLSSCAVTETVCEETEYWKITQKNGLFGIRAYEYSVFGVDGNALIDCARSDVKPEITMTNSYTVKICIDNKQHSTVQFAEIYGTVSLVYENPLAVSEPRYTAYLAFLSSSDSGETELCLHSAYSPGQLIRHKLPDIAQTDSPVISAAFDEHGENITVIYHALNRQEPVALTLPANRLNWQDNPISRFYERYTVDAPSTMQLNAHSMAYYMLWQREFEHGCELLRERSNFEYVNELVDILPDSLDSAAQDIGIIDAYFNNSNAFDEDFIEGDNLLRGSAFSGEAWEASADFMEEAALWLYSLLEYEVSSADELFVFSEEDYVNYLTNEFGCTVEEKAH